MVDFFPSKLGKNPVEVQRVKFEYERLVQDNSLREADNDVDDAFDNSRPPTSEFFQLQDNPDLGITYTKGLNLIPLYQNYAVIVANRLSNNSKLNYFFNIQ